MNTISLDFDGVIHAYSKGWQDGSIYDPPLDGSIDAIKDLMKTHCVFIMSTRDPDQIWRWFDEVTPEISIEIIPSGMVFWNKQGVLGITNRKLAATVYIDDRGLRFTDWPDALADLGKILKP